jgi:hypothetical protein
MLYHGLVEKKICGICTYVSNLQRREWFPLHQNSQTSFGSPLPASYSLGTCGRFFLMHNVAWAWRWTIHSHHVPDMTSQHPQGQLHLFKLIHGGMPTMHMFHKGWECWCLAESHSIIDKGKNYCGIPLKIYTAYGFRQFKCHWTVNSKSKLQ